jgi:hypothetical protein
VAESLQMQVYLLMCKFNFSVYSNRWYFGEKSAGNLGGTTRTLDMIDGECPLEDGIMSKNGFAILEDKGKVLSEAGDIAASSVSKIDYIYLLMDEIIDKL